MGRRALSTYFHCTSNHVRSPPRIAGSPVAESKSVASSARALGLSRWRAGGFFRNGRLGGGRLPGIGLRRCGGSRWGGRLRLCLEERFQFAEGMQRLLAGQSILRQLRQRLRLRRFARRRWGRRRCLSARARLRARTAGRPAAAATRRRTARARWRRSAIAARRRTAGPWRTWASGGTLGPLARRSLRGARLLWGATFGLGALGPRRDHR